MGQRHINPKKADMNAFLAILITILLASNIAIIYFLFIKKDNQAVTNISNLQTENLGDYSVTIAQVLDPYEDALNKAEDGYRYVAIEILLTNNTDKAVYYSTNWTLYDNNGYDYSIYENDYKTPTINKNGIIDINDTTKGWLNFRVLENNELADLKFNDEVLNYSVEFVLKQ